MSAWLIGIVAWLVVGILCARHSFRRGTSRDMRDVLLAVAAWPLYVCYLIWYGE